MLIAHEYGFFLENGTRIVHGQGSIVRNAFTPEMNLPGKMQAFTPGNNGDASCPGFCGPSGLFEFDTSCQMPRHVHMATKDSAPKMGYVVEKIIVLKGVAVAELGGEIYVVPPKTMVTIARGVPHAWVAAPPGLDLQDLDVVVSDGQFLTVYEYEKTTAFFPTKQTLTLLEERDYVECDDLHSIRVPQTSVDYLKKNAFFVWSMTCQRL